MAIVDEFSEEELRNIIEISKSKKEVIERLGYRGGGNSWETIKKRVDKYGIEWEHLKKARKVDYGGGNKSRPLETYLVENSTARGTKFKKRLVDEGLLENMCSICGINNEWNGKSLVLHLDHVNGVNNDNRLENLRVLCPNCHSQTSTYAGRNMKIDITQYIEEETFERIKEDFLNPNIVLDEVLDKNNISKTILKRVLEHNGMTHRRTDYGVWTTSKNYTKQKNGRYTLMKDIGASTYGKIKKYPYKKCLCCNTYIVKKNKRCAECNLTFKRKTKEIPTKEDLIDMIAESSFVGVGRKYGVSGNAVRKWCERQGLPRYKDDIIAIKNGTYVEGKVRKKGEGFKWKDLECESPQGEIFYFNTTLELADFIYETVEGIKDKSVVMKGINNVLNGAQHTYKGYKIRGSK